MKKQFTTLEAYNNHLERISYLKKITNLVIDINEQGIYQAFIDISPHVSNVSVRIFEGEWEREKEQIKFESYYDRTNLGMKNTNEIKDMYTAILKFKMEKENEK